MNDDDLLKRDVLINSGYEIGSPLPPALTSPTTIFVDKSGRIIDHGPFDFSHKYLTFDTIMEGEGFPLGMGQGLHGKSWINIFEEFAHHYPSQIENHLNAGLDIADIVAEFNDIEPEKRPTLLHCQGNYIVADGKHRMSYLKVLYEMAMANPNLSDEEKQRIRNIKLAVRVRPIAGECTPKLGTDSYTIPAFLPELSHSIARTLTSNREQTAFQKELEKNVMDSFNNDIPFK